MRRVWRCGSAYKNQKYIIFKRKNFPTKKFTPLKQQPLKSHQSLLTKISHITIPILTHLCQIRFNHLIQRRGQLWFTLDYPNDNFQTFGYIESNIGDRIGREFGYGWDDEFF